MGRIRGLIRDVIGQINAEVDRRGRASTQEAVGASAPEVASEKYDAPDAGGHFAADGGRDERRQDRNGRPGLVGKVVDGVQQLRQEGGLYAPGQAPKPDLDVENADLRSPASQAHVLSKKRSYFGVLLMAFVLGADWMATLVSVQALWYLVQGPKRLYGLAFGAYDLAALLAVLVLSPWSQRTQTFKMPILTGALVSMAGNFLFAFTVLANKWWFILVARLISGAGSAALYLGEPYLATTTATYGENDVKSVRFRGFQGAGQQVLLLAGMIFLKVNTVTADSSTATKLFNFYTLQGWLLALVLLLMVVPFWLWLFEDPTHENEHLQKKEEEDLGPPTPEQAARLGSLTRLFTLSASITIFTMVGFLSNLFALAAGTYHSIHEQSDLFSPFLPVGLGGLGAGIAYKAALGKTRRKLPVPPAAADERFLVVLCNVLICVAWMLTIPWCGKTCTPARGLLYGAGACVGVASTLYVVALSRFSKLKQQQYRAVVLAQGNPFKALGPFLLLAKFLGPLVLGAVTYLATPSGQTNVCTGQIQNDLCLPTATDAALPQDQCIILGDQYFVDGCILYNAIYIFPVMAGVQLLNCLLSMFIMVRHGSYARA